MTSTLETVHDERPAWFPWRVGSVDTAALQLWLWTRVGVFLAVTAASWLLAADLAKDPASLAASWTRGDAEHYLTIAQWGYDGAPGVGQQVPLEAFFPGLPIVLNVLHAGYGIPHLWLALFVSFVASGVAAVALARIAALECVAGGAAEQLAERTVLVFLTAPAAIFLTAGYPESIFLAFALPAWLCARRGRWVAAGGLGAAATSFGMTGLFLALALVVEFCCARDGRRRWSAAPALALPFLPLLAYGAYLHRRTGDWLHWQQPFGGPHGTDFAWTYGLDLLFVLAGMAVTGWLVRGRRWAEATFVGLQLLTLAASPSWQSIDRYALTWWPLWIALGAWSLRRPGVLTAWLVISVPLMITFSAMFGTGRWAG